MGTPGYMPPEQAQGKRVDQRADVYGVGTILYTVLTGRPPFEEDTPQGTLLSVLNSEPPRPRALVPSIPPHVELIIERAMAKKPEDRFPDMATFERALIALPVAAPLESTAPPPELALPPKSHHLEPRRVSDADVRAARPRLVLALLGVVTLAMAAATVSISGLELASGYTFDQLELRLILLFIAGSSLTPAILWLLHIRRQIWHKSSRVLSLLGALRASLVAGITTYGACVPLLHVVDHFLVRALSGPALPPIGAGWVGWNLILPVTALLMACGVAWRTRLASTLQPGLRRNLALWLLAIATTAAALGLLALGVAWHAGSLKF